MCTSFVYWSNKLRDPDVGSPEFDVSALRRSVTSDCLFAVAFLLVLHLATALQNSLTWMTEKLAKSTMMPPLPPRARQSSSHLAVRSLRRKFLMAELRTMMECEHFMPATVALSSGHAEVQSAKTIGGTDSEAIAARS